MNDSIGCFVCLFDFSPVSRMCYYPLEMLKCYTLNTVIVNLNVQLLMLTIICSLFIGASSGLQICQNTDPWSGWAELTRAALGGHFELAATFFVY